MMRENLKLFDTVLEMFKLSFSDHNSKKNKKIREKYLIKVLSEAHVLYHEVDIACVKLEHISYYHLP